ncbi:hypothetical protein [Capnocytophaga gingivalis]|uniref:hypothetical protein n=1 Tax=Capnocytophaga gingivalis TaxID=1017 RepID=UPI0028D19CCB|nr:hypothetical protein [Capnocytophaga gingivalis]
MNTLEAKREALAKERIKTKYKSHKDCTFIEVVTADKLQEFYDFWYKIENIDLKPIDNEIILENNNYSINCFLFFNDTICNKYFF